MTLLIVPPFPYCVTPRSLLSHLPAVPARWFDVVVNIQAVIVEKASGRRLMSGMHGLWSVGGFAGAGLVAVQFVIAWHVYRKVL